MEEICSSETSVYLHRKIWCYFLENIILHAHHCENLKFNIKWWILMQNSGSCVWFYRQTDSTPEVA
jgi:hypothetical protein